MTEVIVAHEELELVNIIEVSQSKLIKNFTLLHKRLNQTDQTILHQTEIAQNYAESTSQALHRMEQILQEHQRNHAETVQQLYIRIATLQQAQSSSATEAGLTAVGIKRLNDELFNTQLQFQEKMKVKQKQMEDVTRHIHILALEQNRLNDEINKKENKVEAERIVKQTEILKDKNAHFESQLKMAHHKIEKIQILNEKAERLQAKKQVQIMKQIEDRVKKQIKSSGSPQGSSLNATNSYTLIQGQPGNASTNVTNHNISNFYNKNDNRDSEDYANSISRRSSILPEEQMLNMSMNGSENPAWNGVEHVIEKWGDKIKYFEVQLKQIHQNLKVLNKSSSHKRTQANKQNNADGIRDKINQIKPEVVKLWAKIDTIQDRLSFNQRKLQEKMRGVNDLTNLIKQNNVSRLQQKLKSLQTQIFTSLKETKAKLQTKVGQTQYDKYRQQMQEKIGQITDLIYLKSDKLQVKKALLFLQSKIKEIILVISQDEQNQKDALLTKKQLKCISCDKQLDKFSGMVSSPKGNWDGLPFKDHPPEILGRFGMTNFGSLAKKIKKLESKDLPMLTKKSANQSFQNSP